MCNFLIALRCSPGSYKWCNPPSHAVVQSGTLPCSRKLLRLDDGCKQAEIYVILSVGIINKHTFKMSLFLFYLRATLRERGPWYLVLMVKAFSKNRSDKSYSITPCSTSPMLLCGGAKDEEKQWGALLHWYVCFSVVWSVVSGFHN